MVKTETVRTGCRWWASPDFRCAPVSRPPPRLRFGPRARCSDRPPGVRQWDWPGAKSGGQRLVHDDDGRRLAGVGVGEDAPRHQRNRMVRKYAQVTDRSNPMAAVRAPARAAIHGEIRSDSQARQRQAIHGAHSANSRQRRDTVRHLLEEGDPAGRARHSGRRQRQTPGSAGLRAGSPVGRSQPHEGANQQPRANEHHHGQRHFHDHKHAAQPASGARGGAAAADCLQRRIEIGAGALDGGRDAK